MDISLELEVHGPSGPLPNTSKGEVTKTGSSSRSNLPPEVIWTSQILRPFLFQHLPLRQRPAGGLQMQQGGHETQDSVRSIGSHTIYLNIDHI